MRVDGGDGHEFPSTATVRPTRRSERSTRVRIRQEDGAADEECRPARAGRSVSTRGAEGRAVGGRGDERTEVGERPQQAGRGADPLGVGLVVQGVLVREAVADPAGRRGRGDSTTSTQIGAGCPDEQHRRAGGDEREPADDELQPRTSGRRPETVDDDHRRRGTSAAGCSPVWDALEPASRLEPLGVAVEEAVGDGEREELTRIRGEQGEVAAARTRRSRNGAAVWSSRQTKATPATATITSRYQRSRSGFVRKTIRVTSVTANGDDPGSVEPGRFAGGGLDRRDARQPSRAEHQGRERERDVDGEDRPPAAEPDEEAAEGRADDRGGLGRHGERREDAAGAGYPGPRRPRGG